MITAGVSVLSPANLLGRHRPAVEELAERVGVACTQAQVIKAVGGAAPPVSDPRRVSAEFSVLHALRAEHRLAPGPKVVLLVGDGGRAKVAALLVKVMLETEFEAHVSLRFTPSLEVNDRTTLQAALGRYMHEIAEALEAGEPRSTCFAPVGGYKVMTALGFVVGSFMGYPSCYLHEDGQVFHTLAPVPVAIDRARLRTHEALLRRVLAGPVRVRDDAERRAVDEVRYLVETVEDGDGLIVEANAFGHFLSRRPDYAAILSAMRLRTTKAARQDLKGVAAEVRQAGIESLVRCLREPGSYGQALRHELEFGYGNKPLSLFKAPIGPVFRAAYRHDAEAQVVELHRVWTDHDRYDREAQDPGVFEISAQLALEDLEPSTER